MDFLAELWRFMRARKKFWLLPIGLIMRALGKDPLRLKRQPDANSYWIDRRPPGPAPKSMKDQF